MQCAAPRRAERQSNMELLRIVAMLLVVIFHAACALDVSIPEGEFSVAQFHPASVLCRRGSGQQPVHTHQRSFPRALGLQPAPRFAPLGADAVLLAASRRAGAGGGQAFQRARGFAGGCSGALQQLLVHHRLHRLQLLYPLSQPPLRGAGAPGIQAACWRRLFVVFSLLPTVAPGRIRALHQADDVLFLYSLAAYLRLYPDAAGAFARPWRCFAAAAALVALLLGLLRAVLPLRGAVLLPAPGSLRPHVGAAAGRPLAALVPRFPRPARSPSAPP